MLAPQRRDSWRRRQGGSRRRRGGVKWRTCSSLLRWVLIHSLRGAGGNNDAGSGTRSGRRPCEERADGGRHGKPRPRPRQQTAGGDGEGGAARGRGRRTLDGLNTTNFERRVSLAGGGGSTHDEGKVTDRREVWVLVARRPCP